MNIPLLVFAGSARLQSHNRKLARVAAQFGRELGASVTHLELGGLDIPMYNADLEALGTPPDVLRFKHLLFDHPAWIICTPEYNGSYPALLKNAIDWASSPVKGDPLWGSGLRPFSGKVVGMLSASASPRGGLRSLGQLAPLLLNNQCWLTPRRFSLAFADKAFDEQGALLDEVARKGVKDVVEQALWAAARLGNTELLSKQ